jgi:hypothetical protein
MPGDKNVKYYNTFDTPLKNPVNFDRHPIVTVGKLSKPNALSEIYRDNKKLENEISKIAGSGSASHLEIEGRLHYIFDDIKRGENVKSTK